MTAVARRNMFHSPSNSRVSVSRALIRPSKPNLWADHEDRATSIEITGLKTFVVSPKAYFKVETNHSIVGWDVPALAFLTNLPYISVRMNMFRTDSVRAALAPRDWHDLLPQHRRVDADGNVGGGAHDLISFMRNPKKSRVFDMINLAAATKRSH